MYRLFDILEPGMCHFIDCEAGLSRTLPSTDAFHLSYEIIRGDRQHAERATSCECTMIYPAYMFKL